MKQKTRIILEKKNIVIKVVRFLSLSLIILFGLVGCLFLSVALHELSHKSDFSEVVESEEICLLTLPEEQSMSSLVQGSLGYYKFSYDKENKEEVSEITKYTEYKAYSISFLVIFLFAVSSLLLVFNRN